MAGSAQAVLRVGSHKGDLEARNAFLGLLKAGSNSSRKLAGKGLKAFLNL